MLKHNEKKLYIVGLAVLFIVLLGCISNNDSTKDTDQESIFNKNDTDEDAKVEESIIGSGNEVDEETKEIDNIVDTSKQAIPALAQEKFDSFEGEFGSRLIYRCTKDGQVIFSVHGTRTPGYNSGERFIYNKNGELIEEWVWDTDTGYNEPEDKTHMQEWQCDLLKQ